MSRYGHVCSAPACDRPVRYAENLCYMHRRRAARGNDLAKPARVANYNGAPCSVDGCEKPACSNAMCEACDARARKYGAPIRFKAPPGSGSTKENGYRVVQRAGHPVAHRSGRAYEHRVVLFDAIGPGWHPCHWCGHVVTWDVVDQREPDALCVDHVNTDRADNRPENLVPSCWTCNAKRTQTGTTKPRKAAAR